MSLIDKINQHLPAEREKVQATRDQQKSEQALLDEIREAFQELATAYQLTLTFKPRQPGCEWGYFLRHRGKEVARASIHYGHISWAVYPPLDAEPTDPVEPYAMDHLHHRSHHGGFHKLPEAFAKVVAQIETQQ